MVRIDAELVAAANDAWVWTPPGSEVVETAEFRLARFPDRFPDPLQVQWVRSSRSATDVLADIVERAREFGLPEVYVCAKLSAPDGLDEALLARGARLVDTADVLALALPAPGAVPVFSVLEIRWRTTSQVARDLNTVGIEVFGGCLATAEELDRIVVVDRDSIAAGTGGAAVAYADDSPVGAGGVQMTDGVARLWGGGVLETHRGRGVYRALVAARTTYAVEHDATMVLTQGRSTTSSPILRRLGFTCFGQERFYRLSLS